MTIGSLFSGIGGLELGLERAGLGPVLWQVEKGEFQREVLAKHWPSVSRFDDVRTVGLHNLQPVDLICGGFPCQDVSQAARGRNRGLDGDHSGLWREFKRIVGELRPRRVIVENVYSGKGRWLPTVRRDLHVLGYDTAALRDAANGRGGRATASVQLQRTPRIRNVSTTWIVLTTNRGERPMAKRKFSIELICDIEIDDAVISAVDADWRKQFYPLHTADEIAAHIAFNLLVNGALLSQLDGWADKDNDMAEIDRSTVEVEASEIT